MHHKPVYIMGDAIRWPDLSENFSRYIACDLWNSAGIGPKDIDVAGIYDCFIYTMIKVLERLGFCKPDEDAAFAHAGGLRRELIKPQPHLYDDILRRTPLGRLGEPADVAGPPLFLASGAACFVNGQILYVDVGYTAG